MWLDSPGINLNGLCERLWKRLCEYIHILFFNTFSIVSCSPPLYHREQLTWTSALMSSMESPGQARKTRCASWPLKKSISYGQSVKKLFMGKTVWPCQICRTCVVSVGSQWMRRMRIVTWWLWLPKLPCPLLFGLCHSCHPHCSDVAHSRTVSFTVFLACTPASTGLSFPYKIFKPQWFFSMCITCCLSCAYEDILVVLTVCDSQLPLFIMLPVPSL